MYSHKTSDYDLLLALKNGEKEALTEIFKRYWKSLYHTAFQKLRSKAIAEEIVQDLFTEVWDKRIILFRNASDDSLNLSSYLHTAIKNKVLNCIRRQVYDKRYWEYCRQHLKLSENPTEELAEYNDLAAKLDIAVNRLSDKTRKIFVLNKLQGVPINELSKELHLSEKAIEYHLTKSVKELRIHLKEFI